MERKYTILAIFLIVLAFGLVILPEKKDQKELDPGVLLSAISEKSRYLTADLVTERIIGNDPTLLLIDLRPAEQFKLFALPGAVNIQPDSLLSASSLEFLNQPAKDKVLYANSDIISEKAWLIATRHSIGQMYIMKGGMNEWFNTIIKEMPVNSAASSTDLDLLSFRNAARQFFVGAGESGKTQAPPKKRENIQVIRKAPAASSGGGC
ncbi:MAG TPA: rhodanese-like domain-containing protein [Prolixibacteraceae bacterium]|nr:rhodanese-like domain-containing protein [Prolixibacteraceae bacterium]